MFLELLVGKGIIYAHTVYMSLLTVLLLAGDTNLRLHLSQSQIIIKVLNYCTSLPYAHCMSHNETTMFLGFKKNYYTHYYQWALTFVSLINTKTTTSTQSGCPPCLAWCRGWLYNARRRAQISLLIYDKRFCSFLFLRSHFDCEALCWLALQKFKVGPPPTSVHKNTAAAGIYYWGNVLYVAGTSALQ